MAGVTGSLTMADLLAAKHQSVAKFGVDKIAETLRDDLSTHNAIVGDMMNAVAELSTDRQRKYGTSDNGTMQEVGEHGRVETQRPSVGATCGFPMRRFQYAIGWTQLALNRSTPADLAISQQAAQKAHLKRIQREIKRAVYTPTNYTFKDIFVDQVDLAVKAFLNADGADIPEGPNGEVFAGASHTHYDWSDGLTATAALAQIDDVVEHGHGGKVLTVINKADEMSWRGLSGFTAYPDPRLILGTHKDQVAQRLDITRLDNRPIGIFGASEVWVKPWGVANYSFCYDSSTSARPLVYRQHTAEELQGLRIAAENDAFPLLAQFFEAEFGLGAWTRTNGHVLYHAAGATAYEAPTFT